LAQGAEIEDQFTSAVKLVLEESAAVSPSPEVTTESAQVRRHGRILQWRIVLLYMTLTATVTIIVIAALEWVATVNKY
jgi:hypothetical protein